MAGSAGLAPTLRIAGLGRSFGRVEVLRDIDLEIGPGEFVGLMGPNGAGKSTLIKVLDGVYPPSAGTIRLGAQQVPSLGASPLVGFIHQDLGLIDGLTVADNLRLGQSPLRLVGPVLNRPAERAAAARALAAVGLDLPVTGPVGDLSPGEKALVAIARAFARGARILFVDEATSTLPPPDAKRVVAALRAMANAGSTVVMVTHKLSEILGATGRVVLLLDGRIAADRSTTGLGRAELVRMLASHEKGAAGPAGDPRPGPADPAAGGPGRTLLRLDGAHGGRAGPVDLVVRAGEVVGLTGTPGSGLHDVGYLAHGSLRPSRGTRTLAAGVRTALVPPHRETQGGFPDLDVGVNLTVSALRRFRGAFGLLARRRERAEGQRLVTRLKVRPADVGTEFRLLSGGNKQKVIFGRALLREAGVHVLCEPTRGVDVAARAEIYALVRRLPDEHTGVLVVTSDAEDLLAVCDRLATVSDGTVSDFRPVDDLDETALEAVL
ncbi:Ribose transport system ATP-binding protein [Frankia canadensis]|uniref:Ribose transport system ATP-binding protein n=1 Tax=Frankia canadensis TaxID=1836972 RepID=A0A2I2KJT1_9ACTN|nr:ATP-binding cassette domain-containing protein [Frankia canadensis]SNQ45932.1 Ribose transport system ATP-binding protein [Frankia canadensis]SOU53222.1 Ribose transport system ATP-binding protein [Frankia canadensis]